MSDHYSGFLSKEDARKLQRRLQLSLAFHEEKREYALYCYIGLGVSVAYYAKRGKLLVQGKGTDDFMKLLPQEMLVPGSSSSSPEKEGARAESPFELDTRPHFGVDESGKGDYFGPLVVAGVYSDEQTAPLLAEIGCRDSKTVGSDERIAQMAEKIRALQGVECEVLCIGPKRYNELYDSQMGNLNRLLAWGHARVIAALHAKKPDCPRALSDQFANARVLSQALEERDVSIQLEQRPRAEGDIAVAAASILARARFVEWMQQAAESAGCELPLGCAPHVLQAAKHFVAKHGRERLSEVAKLHFKLTKQIDSARGT